MTLGLSPLALTPSNIEREEAINAASGPRIKAGMPAAALEGNLYLLSRFANLPPCTDQAMHCTAPDHTVDNGPDG